MVVLLPLIALIEVLLAVDLKFADVRKLVEGPCRIVPATDF